MVAPLKARASTEKVACRGSTSCQRAASLTNSYTCMHSCGGHDWSSMQQLASVLTSAMRLTARMQGEQHQIRCPGTRKQGVTGKLSAGGRATGYRGLIPCRAYTDLLYMPANACQSTADHQTASVPAQQAQPGSADAQPGRRQGQWDRRVPWTGRPAPGWRCAATALPGSLSPRCPCA